MMMILLVDEMRVVTSTVSASVSAATSLESTTTLTATMTMTTDSPSTTCIGSSSSNNNNSSTLMYKKRKTSCFQIGLRLLMMFCVILTVILHVQTNHNQYGLLNMWFTSFTTTEANTIAMTTSQDRTLSSSAATTSSFSSETKNQK